MRLVNGSPILNKRNLIPSIVPSCSCQVRATRWPVAEEASLGDGPQRVSDPAATATAVLWQSSARPQAGAIRVHSGASDARLFGVSADAATTAAPLEWW